ncbi:hypothetical protein LOC68_23030 [Blastopirellula sp. JC732]|uniref:Uncharacterized protein n=1 Tax=Blastopirellula sediminis TaxID=2894196 RepID=A0A9X1MPX8_9BACT|nr:hypothetical protein [Blastopirellula sediminis]MCC9605422.1 hypothetical protein [Blastopirellula sediminis]MCC9631278.1 hypothetical protein [Blastopirellula sediminis]
MVQLTFLVAVAAVAAQPGHGTTRHLTPPSLRETPAVHMSSDEVGTGVMQQVKYNAPTIAQYPEAEIIEMTPETTEMSVMQYDSAPVEYMPHHGQAYFDRTSRRSDHYYHGCEQYYSFWSNHCMPAVWCCPGNMCQHYPYEASPHFYYYFRPYNAAMIAPQQAVAEQWVSNPRLPYSNDVFDEVYRDFDAKFAPPAEVISQ